MKALVAYESRAASADLLALGTWVEGFILVGVGPARAARGRITALPSLGGKPCGIFCTYAVHPRKTLPTLQGLVEQKGGRVVATLSARGARPETGVPAFAARGAPALAAEAPRAVRMTEAPGRPR